MSTRTETRQSTHLETGRTPIDKLDGPLCLDVADGSIDILWDNVSSVQQTTSHVLSLPGVALDHLVVALETSDGHLRNRVGLVEGCCQLANGQVDLHLSEEMTGA